MKIRTKVKTLEWNNNEYLSVGYDTNNLGVYLIKGDIKEKAENILLRNLESEQMAHDLSMSIYIAKENNVPMFDIEAWIKEYKNR